MFDLDRRDDRRETVDPMLMLPTGAKSFSTPAHLSLLPTRPAASVVALSSIRSIIVRCHQAATAIDAGLVETG
jgi:hypothetical protein